MIIGIHRWIIGKKIEKSASPNTSNLRYWYRGTEKLFSTRSRSIYPGKWVEKESNQTPPNQIYNLDEGSNIPTTSPADKLLQW